MPSFERQPEPVKKRNKVHILFLAIIISKLYQMNYFVIKDKNLLASHSVF
jgi:hypothetical protein